MSVKSQTVTNYEEFEKVVEELDKKGEKAVLLFSGSKEASGLSWCPDCVGAEPVIEKYLTSKITEDLNLVRIELERTYFKDPNNPFRTSSKVRLSRVPTIMQWKGIKRLEENECQNVELLEMFFEGYNSFKSQ